MFANLFRGQIVDVSLAIFDQLDRPFVELVEIIGSIEEAVPVEAKPLDVFHDGVDVLDIFLLRIGVVEAQVGMSAELVGETEVEADRFGVSDMQVAVGLRRKSRLHAPVVLVRLQSSSNSIAKKVGGTRLGRGIFRHFCLSC